MPFLPQKPWEKGQPILADRLQDMQARPVVNIITRPPLNSARNGNDVSIFLSRESQARQAYITFRVKLVQSGGSNGDNTTAPSYTYHAYYPNDTTNFKKLNEASSGAAVSPEKVSPVGKVTAATIGLAYYDDIGAFKLYEAYEKPTVTQGCT